MVGRGERVWLVLVYALLTRLLVGQHSYSGFSGNMQVETRRTKHEHDSSETHTNVTSERTTDIHVQDMHKRHAPNREPGFVWRYGDYEAQRHWMEMAMHLPMKQWYTYDLDYWGLDYPPVTMYQSLLHAWIMKACADDGQQALEMDTSRGYESAPSKRIMRFTAICSESLLLWPALVAAALMLATRDPDAPTTEEAATPGKRTQMPMRGDAVLAICLMQPVLLLIDHGHFQYNSASLGLSLGAAVVICSACNAPQRRFWWATRTEGVRHCIGAILYTLAFMHKHIALYYSLAFFAHLLGGALRLGSIRNGAMRVGLLGIVVIGTFTAVLAPWIGEGRYMQVFARLFPLKRGVFEDYVANFWCATNPIMRWKTRAAESTRMIAVLGAIMTLAAALPTVVRQILHPGKRVTNLLLCMFNTSLAFFLFGFQVHEKSILYPLLPASLLTLHYPRTMLPFSAAATLSIVPLMRKDGLGIATLAASTVYAGALLLIVHGGTATTAADTGGGDTSDTRIHEEEERDSDRKLTRSATNATKRRREDGKELPVPPPKLKRAALAIAFVSSRVQALWFKAAVPALLGIAAVAAITPICGAPAPGRLPYIYELILSAACFVLFLGSCIAANVIQWHLSDAEAAAVFASNGNDDEATTTRKKML